MTVRVATTPLTASSFATFATTPPFKLNRPIYVSTNHATASGISRNPQIVEPLEKTSAVIYCTAVPYRVEGRCQREHRRVVNRRRNPQRMEFVNL